MGRLLRFAVVLQIPEEVIQGASLPDLERSIREHPDMISWLAREIQKAAKAAPFSLGEVAQRVETGDIPWASQGGHPE